MKAKILCRMVSFSKSNIPADSAAFLVLIALVFAGCATPQPIGKITRSGKILTDAARCQLGTVGVVAPATPASFGFDKSDGRINYADDRAGLVAHNILSFEPIPHPWLAVIPSALETIVAPVAAGGAALEAEKRKLPPAKFEACEERVSQALTEAAGQSRLKVRILQVAAEKGRRQLVPFDRNRTAQPHVDTILEPQIEELRLERIGRSDASFVLRVRARVSLIDSANANILYDEPFEYVSGTALFLDWSMDQSLAAVADTACDELADQIVGRLFSEPVDGPILLGAGFKRPSSGGLGPVQYASNRRAAGPFKRLTTSQSSHPMFVDYRIANFGAIGIYSTSMVSHITVQRPSSRSEAISQTLDDLGYAFDGLDDFPNIFVQLGVGAASLPLSLYKQTAAAIHGVSEKTMARADAALAAAIGENRPHEEVAREVARHLAPQTTQPVMLVKKPISPGEPAQYATMECVARGTLTALPGNQNAAGYLVSQGANNALEIEITKCSLEGKDGVNSSLALCVEARALLFRARDGRPIYSCPLRYRSDEHKFTEWAGKDARLFRAEVDKCYRQIGAAIADQLVGRQIVVPKSKTLPAIASN